MLNAVVLIVCIAVFWSASPRLAGAHEVRLVVAIAAATDSPSANDSSGLDGMQLGIDQSPDVGHAPGPDAGDHLGGVDVEVVVTAASSQVEELDADDAEIVVLLDPTKVSTVAGELADRPTLLVAVLTDDAALPDVRPDRMVILRPTPRSESSTTALAFETAFLTAHQRPPSAADAIAYDVSQVLDVVLAETDGAVADATSASAYWSEARTRLISSRLEVAFAPEGSSADRPTPTPPVGDERSELFGPRTMLALGVLGVLGLGAFVWAALRWRRHPPDRAC